MCGLVGECGARVGSDDLSLRVDSALQRIRHRGPDNIGSWISRDRRIGLGHVRLSIIDPSESARQPMVDTSGRYILVFNGEIYNFRTLYQQFLSEDHAINKNSDTSVLLHLLVRLGKDAIGHLDGMFAFAFVDLRKESVLIGRDRFGEKPIYYLSDQNSISFSSELVGLRTLQPHRNWMLDRNAVALFHVQGSIMPPRTIYEGVRALQPGCWLQWTPGTEMKIGPYWHAADDALNDVNANDAVDYVGELLGHAVRSRFVSDVPVGIFLSGGIDSSSIVATANSSGMSVDAALCIDFLEDEYSEAKIAQSVANQYGIPFHRYVIERSYFNSQLPHFFAAMDQPTVDGFNTYFISKAAGELGIKVWLSGVGGDEVFGGYPSFERLKLLEQASWFFQRLVTTSFAQRMGRLLGFSRYARALHLAVNGDTTLRAYQVCRTAILPQNCSDILNCLDSSTAQSLQARLDGIAPKMSPALDYFQRASLLETALYMGPQLLRDIDNFSMCESIEVRAPYLDHRLYEYVWKLPAHAKNYGNVTKPLLVDSVPGGIPDATPITQKRGFSFPMKEWLRPGLKHDFHDLVLDSRNSDIWNLNTLHKLFQEYEAGRVNWHVIWTFFVFATWRNEHNC